MRMSDLQSKDIVNTKNGKKVGRIIDLIVNESGYIEYLVIDNNKIFNKLNSMESKVTFNNIIKFGDDVILVEID